MISPEERFEAARQREVIAVAKHLVELGPCFERRREGVAGVELKGAPKPSTQTRRQRLVAAAGRQRPGGRDDVADPRRILIVLERTPEDERQRHHPDLGHVGSLIEPREANRARQRDAQLVPVPLLRKAQLLEGRAERVLDDHEPGVRRDHQSLGTERAVGHIAGRLVQDGDGGDQLPNQAQGRVDVEAQLPFVRPGEEVRQADTCGHVGDHREGLLPVRQALDGAYPAVVGVTEAREAADPLAQRELERRHLGQLLTQAEQFPLLVTRGVHEVSTLPEAIAERNRRGCRCGNRGSFHGSPLSRS